MASYCRWHRIARQTQHKLVLPFKHASCKCSWFPGNRNTILNGTIPNKPSTSTTISLFYASMDKTYPISSLLPQFFILSFFFILFIFIFYFILFTAKHYTQLNLNDAIPLRMCNKFYCKVHIQQLNISCSFTTGWSGYMFRLFYPPIIRPTE
jgi:hypothetical protein